MSAASFNPEAGDKKRRVVFSARAGVFTFILFFMSVLSPGDSLPVKRGDYSVEMSDYGPVIKFRDQIISQGSSFFLWRAPGGEKQLGGIELESWASWANPRRKWLTHPIKTQESDSAKKVSISGQIEPNLTFEYDISVSDGGADVKLKVNVTDESKAGVCEFIPFYFPIDLVKNSCFQVDSGKKAVTPGGPDERPDRKGLSNISAPGKKIVIQSGVGAIQIESDAPVWLLDLCFNRNVVPPKMKTLALAGTLRPGTPVNCSLKVTEPAPPEAGSNTGLWIQSGGKPAAARRIVTPDNPNIFETKAAAELAAILKQIFGKSFEIKRESEVSDRRGSILLGQAAVQEGLISKAELGKIAPDGYTLRVKDGIAGIAGFRGAGTFYGIYGFLSRMGVKVFAPECRIVPRLNYYQIPCFSFSDKPAFELRAIFGMGTPESTDRLQLPELGFTSPLDAPSAELADPRAGNTWWTHTATYLCPQYKYFDTHPEYYARNKRGEMLTTMKTDSVAVHLCLANQETRQIAAERLSEWMDKFPDARYFWIAEGDGPDYCECPACRALDGTASVDGTDTPCMSARTLDFVNAAARKIRNKHPGKILITSAYMNSTIFPPRHLSLEPNVRVAYSTHPAPGCGGGWCHGHDLFCFKNRAALRDIKAWLKSFPEQIYICDYPCDYKRFSPFFCLYAMADKIKFYDFAGIRGVIFCGAPRLFGDLTIYVHGRLLWHPELDVNPLIDEFMTAYYGNAAPAMRAFLNLTAQVTGDRGNPKHLDIFSFASNSIVTPEFAAKAYPLLQEAETAVKDDPELLARVRYEKYCGVLLPDLDANTKKKLICNGGINYELLGKLRALRDVFQSGFGRRSDRENKGLSLEEGLKPDIKTWMLRVFGLRIDKSLWYESEMVRDALDNTDAFLKKHKDDPLFADSNPTEAERISACQWSLPDGLSLKPDAFTGCDKLKENGRECVVIYPKGDPRGDGASAMSASFFLDKTPRTCVLTLEGRDDDKPGAVNIEISINDRTVFSGPNRAAETGWTRLMFPAEPNILSPGWNTLRISNLETTDKYFEKWFEIAAVSLQWKADEK